MSEHQSLFGRCVLPLDVERQGPRATVRVLGDLDVLSSPSLGRCLDGLLDGDIVDLVVDLGAVPFCDSAGLSVLLGAHRDAQGLGAHLTLVEARPEIRRLLAITGLDRILDVR